MRYNTIDDLPEPLRKSLPMNAQSIYLEAYQEAWEDFDEEEEGEASRSAIAHRNAMAAVHGVYDQDSESGEWTRKDGKPIETKSEDDGGFLDNILPD